MVAESDIAVDKRSQLTLGHGANFLGMRHAVFEQDQRRDTADAELGRYGRVRIDVQLDDTDLAFVSSSYFLENRSDRFASPSAQYWSTSGLSGAVLANRSLRFSRK